MNFFEYLTALGNWDKKRCEEKKFPIVSTLKYLYWLGLATGLAFLFYQCGYSRGSSDVKWEQFKQNTKDWKK